MLYEMESRRTVPLSVSTFVGLEALIGPVPEGMSAEEAYDARVHPEDREVYDGRGGSRRASRSRSSIGCSAPTAKIRWVLDRMRPNGRAEDGSLLVNGVVADISDPQARRG